MGVDGTAARGDVRPDRSGRSVVGRLRTGEWTARSLSPLVVAAAASVLLDAVTTYHVLTNDAYTEGNVVLVALADVHPLAASGWQLATAGLFVLIAALSLGWVSTTAGAIVVFTNGLLGVNNLVLFATGTALVAMAGVEVAFAVHVATPLLGVAAGLLLEWSRHSLPWREVLAGSILYLAAEIGPVALL